MKWKLVKLGQVCTLFNGRAYKQPELLNSGSPVMRIQNLNGGDKWYSSDLDLPENKYCDKGDLLYAWSGSFGPYLWKGEKCIYHYHIWKIVHSNILDKKFLFYLLNSITHRIKASGHGIALIHVTKKGMEEFLISLPPLETQKRIVDLLDRAQALIDKRKEQIALMDQLVQSLFYDMFGDPVTNPMGWEVGKIGDLAVKTQYGTSKKAHESIGNYPILRMNNITYSGGWNFSNLKFIEFDENEQQKYLVYRAYA
jgi:type I restriction enzyme S subunit